MGGVFYQGLRYEALGVVEGRLPPLAGDELPDSRTLLRQLQLLEREAKQHLNARR